VTGGCKDGRRGFEVDALHRLAQIVAAADEVAKVLVGDFGLELEFARFLLLQLQLLDVALQTDAYIVGRALESAPDLGADAQRVLVRVVDGSELLGQLRAQAVRERLRY
jgi:hypothetical protein